ncbi:hypothetical protein BRM97_13440 [Xanthomonas oryzae pv. oryzae]|nr:hypothetical protein BRM97_13440 [Xanthomonas oryzae pv. oryzae]
MPPHSEQIVSRICGALFRGSLETHPMRCSVMFGDRSPATAPLNRRPSCGPPGAIAALVCKTGSLKI